MAHRSSLNDWSSHPLKGTLGWRFKVHLVQIWVILCLHFLDFYECLYISCFWERGGERPERKVKVCCPPASMLYKEWLPRIKPLPCLCPRRLLFRKTTENASSSSSSSWHGWCQDAPLLPHHHLLLLLRWDSAASGNLMSFLKHFSPLIFPKEFHTFIEKLLDI